MSSHDDSAGSSGEAIFPIFRWIDDATTAIGFDALPSFDAFSLLTQLLVATVAAGLAFWFIHAGQRRAAEEGRRIERAKFLHELDREYYNLLNAACVVRRSRGDGAKVQDTETNLETVLRRDVVWFKKIEMNKDRQRIYHEIKNRRHVRISEEFYIDTITLHLVISWSKHVASGMAADIVDRHDVADMWRSILPWAKNNRFSFIADFFNVSAEALGKKDPDFSDWYPGMLRRLRYRTSRKVDEWRRRRAQRTDRSRTLRTLIPREWSGDVAPLFLLIRTIAAVAVEEERRETLHFIGLHRGPNSAEVATLDPLARLVLLGHKV